MSDKKTEKLFQKAVSAVRAKKGRGLVFGNSIPTDHPGMDKDAFIKMILANVKTNKWLSGHFTVDGHVIGVKAYGLWVQRLVRPDLSSAYHDSGMFIKTQKALREWLNKSLTQLGIGEKSTALGYPKPHRWKVGDVVGFKGTGNTAVIKSIEGERIIFDNGEGTSVHSSYLVKRKNTGKAVNRDVFAAGRKRRALGYQPYRGELAHLVDSLRWGPTLAPVGAARAKQILSAALIPNAKLPRPGQEILIDKYKDASNPWSGINVSLYLENNAGQYLMKVLGGQIDDYLEPKQVSPLIRERMTASA